MEQLGIKQDIAKLQQLLGSKLYSNKYSFLSEVLQNSTDAMRKCRKQDESFDVGVVKRDGVCYFYTRDTGCSFDSVERFKELMNLLESSKSQVKDSSENQELGKFGIGSVAVSAYNKNWCYKVYKNQKGFDAHLQEIEGKGLFMDCSDYYNTEEIDGVYFEVEINTNLRDFFKNLVEKAKYFQNIRFKFDEYFINDIYSYQFPTQEDLIFINERFQIFKSEDFQYSTLNKNNNLHICIDQYNYDINWNQVGISSIELPIALRFNLDDFDINPTREVLSIDESYKDKILNKIGKVADWLIDKYNEQNPVFECSNIKEYKDELKRRQNKILKIGDVELDIYDFCREYSDKTFNLPTFRDISVLTLAEFTKFLKHYWNSFYKTNSVIKNGTRKKYSIGHYNYDHNFLIEKSIKKVHQDWFKTQNDVFCFSTIDRSFEFIVTDVTTHAIYYKSYVEYLKKTTITNEEFLLETSYKKQFEDFKFLKEDFEKHIFKRIENVVPLDYVISKPKVVKPKKEKLQKSEEEVFLKYPRNPQKSTAWYAVWEDVAIKLGALRKQPKLHIYGTESNRTKLEALFTKFQSKNNNLQLIMVNDKTEKLIKEENPHNFINVEDLKNKFSVLSNYITASYIEHNLQNYKVLLNNSELIKQYISLNIGLDIDNINKILKDNNVDDIFYDVERNRCSEIIKSLVDFYTENPKMYNQDYIYLYNKLEKVLQKLDFVELFVNDVKATASYQVNKKELAIKTMRELCRMKQIRMNWENYNLDKIEEFYKPIAVIVPDLELVENEQ